MVIKNYDKSLMKDERDIFCTLKVRKRQSKLVCINKIYKSQANIHSFFRHSSEPSPLIPTVPKGKQLGLAENRGG